MEVLEKYQLKFYKLADGRVDVKSDGDFIILSDFIFIYRDVEDVEDFISDLNLAINNSIDDIDDNDYGGQLGSYYNAEIMENGLVIWQEVWEDRLTVPLEDMRDILQEWKVWLKD